MKVTIHEVIRRVDATELVELIDVPLRSEPAVLLRIKSMREFAFVMWTRSDIGSVKMTFRMPQTPLSFGLYTVLCACCNSGTYGLPEPVDKERLTEWKKERGKAFSTAVSITCRLNKINTIFMRRANAWDEHYGVVEGLNLVEAQDHKAALLEHYSPEVVSEGLQFIDYSLSYGMGK